MIFQNNISKIADNGTIEGSFIGTNRDGDMMCKVKLFKNQVYGQFLDRENSSFVPRDKLIIQINDERVKGNLYLFTTFKPDISTHKGEVRSISQAPN